MNKWIDNATHYTIASRGNVLLYSVGSTLYAYDFSYKALTSMDLGKEICSIGGDAVLNNASYWVATYDESSKTGELRCLTLGGTNRPELICNEEEDCWPVAMKIKKVEWKYGEDPAEEEPEEEE